ncbi:hypothetical protein N7519_011379 [Penicillium mononematosum]|uniref:uncharacterized protein n=1 Tax=Penicillium mononematosum TaxID=268346 RepID=UPI002547259C|nr:uncharacterized protein N7519_011379 [Penicillium mononematosum]KAJ6180918.1 hypothetical protein N7519_011379 [Penicillium mononematosum]
MVDEFVGVLESFLGTKRVNISLAERWEQCPPSEANGKPLKQYLSKSAFWSMCYDYYHGFDDFRSIYSSKYGKLPFEGPVLHYRWEIGKEVTPDEYNTYREELKVFQRWFDENIFSQDPNTLSEAIMIMPYGSANPKYRDTPNESPSSAGTIGEKFISPVLGIPQLVLPSEAAFRAASWPTSVDVGRDMFPLADNVRNVAPVDGNSKEQGLLQLQALNSKF